MKIKLGFALVALMLLGLLSACTSSTQSRVCNVDTATYIVEAGKVTMPVTQPQHPETAQAFQNALLTQGAVLKQYEGINFPYVYRYQNREYLIKSAPYLNPKFLYTIQECP